MSDVFYTSACVLPWDSRKVLVGTSTGTLLLFNLKDPIPTDRIQYSEDGTFSWIINSSRSEITHHFLHSYIRSIQRVSDLTLVGITSRGGIFILNAGDGFAVIQREQGSSRMSLMQLLVINENKFLAVGLYGRMQVWIKKDDVWQLDKELRPHSAAFFCLNWYDQNKGLVITNNYNGDTSVWDTDFNLQSTWNLARNLQAIIVEGNKLITVSYSGFVRSYEKRGDSYSEIERFNCAGDKVVCFIKPRASLPGYIAGFPTHFFAFSPAFDDYKRMDTPCRALLTLDAHDVILTDTNLVSFNEQNLITPSDFIRYRYIRVGLVGDSRSGKTSLYWRIANNVWKPDISSSFGSHTWLYKPTDDKMLYFIDLAGQEQELPFFLPRLKTCNIILILFPHSQGQQAVKNALTYYKQLKDSFPNCQIFLVESLIDDPHEGVRKSKKEEIFREAGISYEDCLQVSSKSGMGIDTIREILNDSILWENAIPVVESELNNAIISRVQKLYDTAERPTITLAQMQHLISGTYGTVHEGYLRDILLKKTNEGLLYFLSEVSEIIIDTKEMQEVESEILKIFAEKKGFLSINDFKNCIESAFENPISLLDYYTISFLHYLENENLIWLITKENSESESIRTLENIKEIVIWKDLEPLTQLLLDLKKYSKIEFVFTEKILFEDLLTFTEKKLGSLCELGKNYAGFLRGNPSKSKIYYEFEEINSKTSELSKIKVAYNLPPKQAKILLDFFAGQRLKEIPKTSEIEECVSRSNKEQLITFLCNHPEEGCFWDFKKECNYRDSQTQAEILKDCIALGNSAIYNNNQAFLVVGIEEKDGIFQGITAVVNPLTLAQQISALCNEYVRNEFGLHPIPIKTSYIQQLIQRGLITTPLPLSAVQQSPTCQDQILIICIERKPGAVLEVSRDFQYKKSEPGGQTKQKTHQKGKAWYRIASHSYLLTEDFRRILRVN